MKTCESCGASFDFLGRGRPRRFCLGCRPATYVPGPPKPRLSSPKPPTGLACVTCGVPAASEASIYAERNAGRPAQCRACRNTDNDRLCVACGGSLRGLAAWRRTCSPECAASFERDKKRARPGRTRPCRGCGKPCVIGGGSAPEPTCRECRRSKPEYRARYRVSCSRCCKEMIGSTRPGHASAATPVCLECRRKDRVPLEVPPACEARRCGVCSNVYMPRKSNSRTCGPTCAAELKRSRKRNLSRDRQAMIVASRNAPDPLTTEDEAAMRRAAKRCPMPGCGARLTDKPFLPNSKELDHIVPRCLNGAHTIGNTRIICRLCNARRPDDGSDIDQLDLFSVLDPAAIAVAQMPRVPRVLRSRQKQGAVCTCGAPALPGGFVGCHGRRLWCVDCRAEVAANAAGMRAMGTKWQDISDTLGLGGSGATYNLVANHVRAA